MCYRSSEKDIYIYKYHLSLGTQTKTANMKLDVRLFRLGMQDLDGAVITI